MSDQTPGLDEAFERLAASGFELPNGFVNHGPMACEALAALGCDDDIDSWARRFARSGGTPVEPGATAGFEWQESLGEYRQLPQWIGYFERSIDRDGWSQVVAEWVPRLLPALVVALFHGAIRAAHAVRAIDAVDTEARRSELARALGYWAARYGPGQPADEDEGDEGEGLDDLRSAVSRCAADGARRYIGQPNIFFLHGVTGAMAVELFVDHISPEATRAGLAQIRAEHRAIYRDAEAVHGARAIGVPAEEVVRSAADSGDPHQVKLVEACRRGFEASGDPVFVVAAETVTGMR